MGILNISILRCGNIKVRHQTLGAEGAEVYYGQVTEYSSSSQIVRRRFLTGGRVRGRSSNVEEAEEDSHWTQRRQARQWLVPRQSRRTSVR